MDQSGGDHWFASNRSIPELIDDDDDLLTAITLTRAASQLAMLKSYSYDFPMMESNEDSLHTILASCRGGDDGLLELITDAETGKEMLAKGSHNLYKQLAHSMEAALGREMPRMEVRFQDLSIAAEVAVASGPNGSKKHEIPTIPHVIRRAIGQFGAKKSVVHKQILNGLNGVLRPGTMTLLLGQPGSGKSSFLKVLSGRFPKAKNVSISGRITYNGQSQQDMKDNLAQFVAYVTQHDHHFGTLTVKETFEFAHEFSGSALPRHTAEMLRSGNPELVAQAEAAIRGLFRNYPEIMLHQLGLENCKDTMIGDAITRGVSGGERKRVTLGEMEFGLKNVALMDEISTGLDSAATYDIVKNQRSLADRFKKTIVMSLLQPSPQTFELFDDLILLNQGEVMYYGPCAEAQRYFEAMGFLCPPHRDTADFLMDLGTPQQQQYERKGWPRRIPTTPAEFGDLYRHSAVCAAMEERLDTQHDPALNRIVEDHIQPMPEFQQSYWTNMRTVLRRQMLIAARNRAFIFGRAFMVVVMGGLYSGLLYQLNPLNPQMVMCTAYMALFFVTQGQFTLLPALVAAREIFYKQRASNFIRASAYVMSHMMSQVPFFLAETLTFGSLVYWMCGFEGSALAFVNFELVLLLTNFCFASWFFMLSSWAPNLHVVKPVALVSLLFFILFSGFVIFRSQIPNYLIWMYWINPMAWSLRALSVNQYRAPTFDVCEKDGLDYCRRYGKNMGEFFLSFYDVPSERQWIYSGMAFLFASGILFMILNTLLLEYRRIEGAENHGPTAPQDDAASSTDASEFLSLRTPKLSSAPAEMAVQVGGRREATFVPVTLAFHELRYAVPDPQNPKETIELLKGISGYAAPGTMTALMGSSGAGKTTLMDVIAGRKTGGQISGAILMNGHPATELAMCRATGYCEQTDVHLESATFREALTFSAFLRQSSEVPDEQKYDAVEECLDLLDLRPIADRIVRGASIEQLKRLTIGVELAAQPSVIFLDEPTSGLDARSAKVIMDGVRKVANTGRTIVCTIHQPSTEVFELFDSLLLLKKGGETVYFGDLGKGGRNLVQYFENLPGVKPLPTGYNPATWMLECIGAGVNNAPGAKGEDVDFVKCFQASSLRAKLDQAMQRDGVTRPSPDLPEIRFTSKRASTMGTQFRFLLQRSFRLHWRTASYNLTRLVISIALALIFIVVFGQTKYSSYQGLNSGVGMVFLASVFKGIISFSSCMPLTNEERTAFYRERAAETYNALWYFVASTIVEIPFAFANALIFTVIFFPAVGFQGFGTAVLYWVASALLILMQTYFGHALMFAFPTIEVALIIGVLLNGIFFTFMGFAPPAAELPKGLRFLFHATPQRYPFAALSALVFADCEAPSHLGCEVLSNAPPQFGRLTVKMFVEHVFEMRYDRIGEYFAITCIYIVIFRLLALLAMRFINHTKR